MVAGSESGQARQSHTLPDCVASAITESPEITVFNYFQNLPDSVAYGIVTVSQGDVML